MCVCVGSNDVYLLSLGLFTEGWGRGCDDLLVCLIHHRHETFGQINSPAFLGNAAGNAGFGLVSEVKPDPANTSGQETCDQSWRGRSQGWPMSGDRQVRQQQR